MVEKTEFDSIDETIRNTTNRQVAMKTKFKVLDMMHHDHISPSKPMAAFAANYFQVYICFFKYTNFKYIFVIAQYSFRVNFLFVILGFLGEFLRRYQHDELHQFTSCI